MQEVHLAAALQFAQYRLAHEALGLLAHEGLDCQSALGRGGDHREVANALERQGQRARNRRGRQRQHVDFGAQRLQPLFLPYAEAVLLVDDDEPEALELHVLSEQLVRADHDVDRAGIESRDRIGNLFRRAESRQLDDVHRPLREAVSEGVEVLLGEQRRRAQHCHLFAADHRGEARAQRHLGLAEADVAADQPVHREARAHVLQHRVDRGLLVRRLFKAEAFGEGFVVVLAELEGVPLARGAQRIEVQQLRGGVAHLLGRLATRLVPLAGAELMQWRGGGIGAAVTADQMQLRDRHVQRGFIRVLELQELGRPAAEIDRLQPEVAADAVLDMHHRIADAQLGEVADHRLDVRGSLALLAAQPPRARRVQLRLGQDRELRAAQRESFMQRRDAECDPRRTRGEIREVGAVAKRDAEFGEHLAHRFAPARRVGDDQDAAVVVLGETVQARDRVFGAPLDRERRQRRIRRVVEGGSALAKHDAAVALCQREECLGIEEQRTRRQDRPR